MEKVFVMTLILVMVALGGMLQGGYVHYEKLRRSSGEL